MECINARIEQNHKLAQEQLVIECMRSTMLAQIAGLSPEPANALDRINSGLSGMAMGVAARSSNLGIGREFDTKAIT